MPFNFQQRKHYSIDYVSLFNELNSNKILNDEYIQCEYLKQWIKVLKDADRFIAEELKTKWGIKNLNLFLESEPEIFERTMTHKCGNIYIQFNASVANKITSDFEKHKKIQTIDLQDFTKENSKVDWTPVKEDVNSYYAATSPIIMVPFLSGKYRWIVIDGNHRLTYKMKNNISQVDAILISEQSVIEKSVFPSGFDKFYYIMHNELNRMKVETDTKNTNALELVQKSYLVDGKFKFI